MQNTHENASRRQRVNSNLQKQQLRKRQLFQRSIKKKTAFYRANIEVNFNHFYGVRL